MYKEIELDTKALKFVLEKLSFGNFYSRKTIGKIRSQKQEIVITTFLPVNTPFTKMYSFEWGGITSSIVSEDYLINFLKSIEQYNFFIIEELVAKSTDSSISKYRDKYFCIENSNSIYWFLTESNLNKDDKIKEVLKLSNRYPFIAFAGNYAKAKILQKQHISTVEAVDISMYISLIIIGAYDEQGFLIVKL